MISEAGRAGRGAKALVGTFFGVTVETEPFSEKEK
jgi:hypothetical protein